LHFGGFYGKRNFAVSIWKMKEDPVLKSNGVRFD
jgi:hypothetical protein